VLFVLLESRNRVAKIRKKGESEVKNREKQLSVQHFGFFRVYIDETM
jgi:hypothetical protein